MKPLTFITGNPKKLAQLKQYLSFPVLHKALDIPEIQSMDVAVVATEKAKLAYALLGTPVLVEDAALSCAALNGLPGPFVKWYLEAVQNIGIINALARYDDKRAEARVCFALCDENGVRLFQNARAGSIAPTPRGDTNPFGWNPIFVPDGCSKTWAEMNPEEASASSMRRPALQELQEYLDLHYR